MDVKKTAVILIGVLWLAGCQRAELVEPFTFLVVADTHIDAANDLEYWQLVLQAIETRDADFLLVLGDVVFNLPEYLDLVKDIADRSGIEVFFLPGNHDDNYGENPEYWTGVFPSLHYSFKHKGVTFILNWSQSPEESTKWLSSYLDSLPEGSPLVYCQHYNPQRSWFDPKNPFPILLERQVDIILTLHGHHHNRLSEQSGEIRSETLSHGFMHPVTNGKLYEARYLGGKELILSEMPLSWFISPPRETVSSDLQIKQSSNYLLVNDSIAPTIDVSLGESSGRIAWRIDRQPWQSVENKDLFTIDLSGSEMPPGHNMLIIKSECDDGLINFDEVFLFDEKLLELQMQMKEQIALHADYGEDSLYENIKKIEQQIVDLMVLNKNGDSTGNQSPNYLDTLKNLDDLDLSWLLHSIHLYRNFQTKTFYRGQNYLNQDSLDLAITQFTHFLSVSKSDWSCFNNIAIAYERKGLPDSALVYYSKAYAMAPDSAGTSVDLAVVLNRLNRTAEAIDILSKFVISRPNNYLANFNLGNWHLKLKHYKKSEHYYLKALEIDPGSFNCHLNLGLIYTLHLRDFALAAEHFQTCLNLIPDHPENPRIRAVLELLKSTVP
ncbi:tetratricopeptide repeat protein [Gemmatimonadota bacterium]